MKKCKKNRSSKKYQVGGNVNPFSFLPNLGTYKDLNKSWNNYWYNGGDFANHNLWKLNSPNDYYSNKNSPGYDPEYEPYQTKYNTALNNYLNNQQSQYDSYLYDKANNPDFDPRIWGDINQAGVEIADPSQIDPKNLGLSEYKNYATIDKNKEAASLMSGIFSGLNYMNSFKPEQKDYWSKGSQGYMYNNGGNVNYTGYTPGTPTFNNSYNIIPSNSITMRNTPFPVLGIGSNGNTKIMKPGSYHNFGLARNVTEIPLYQYGAMVNNAAMGANNYIYQKEGELLKQLANGEQIGPEKSNPEFNQRMLQNLMYNNSPRGGTPLPLAELPILEPEARQSITKARSQLNDNLIYNLKGDKTWEYSKDGDKWLTRKRGTRKWIDISNNQKAIDVLEGRATSKITNPTKTKSTSSISNPINNYDFINQQNYGLPIDGYQNLTPLSNSIDINRSGFSYGITSPYINIPNNPSNSSFDINNEFIPSGYAFSPSGTTFKPSEEAQTKGTSNLISGAITGGLAFRNPYAALATGVVSGVEGALFGTNFVDAGVTMLSGANYIKNSKTLNPTQLLKNGKSIAQQQREKLASGEWISDNMKYYRNAKGQLQNFKDTRGTIQRLMQDKNITNNVKNIIQKSVESGKRISKDVYNKLSRKEKNQYDQFFQEENLMQQTIRERANRGVATSFNKFQFGGEVNNLVVEPRFEEEAPLQAEIGEMIKLPNDDIVKVKADKRHKHMKDEDITDILPDGSYIYSNDPKMKIGLSTKINNVKIEDIKLGKSVFEYKENEITPGPKDIYFKDIFNGKKELTPAQIASNIKNKYKTLDIKNDYFVERANSENKAQRKEYLEVLKGISEYKKPKSKQIPKAQYGMQINYELTDPASLYMKTPFNNMDNNYKNMMGYGIPKAQFGKLLKYINPLALLAEDYFQGKAEDKVNKLSAEENERLRLAMDQYKKGLTNQTNLSGAGSLAAFAASLNVPRENVDDRLEQIGFVNEADKRNRLSIAAQMYGSQGGASNSFNRNALSVFGQNALPYAQSMVSRDNEMRNQINSGLNSELRNQNNNYYNSLSNLVSSRNADYNRTNYAYDANKYNAMVNGINDVSGTFANNIGLHNNFGLYRYNNEEALRRQQNLRKEQALNKVTSEVEGVTGAIGDLGMGLLTGGITIPGMSNNQKQFQNDFQNESQMSSNGRTFNAPYIPNIPMTNSFSISPNSSTLSYNSTVPGYSVNRYGTLFNPFFNFTGF